MHIRFKKINIIIKSYIAVLLKNNVIKFNEHHQPPANIDHILLTFLLSYFNILGNDINDKHLSNMLFISVTFLVFHFDISGNDINEEHPKNILLISVTFSVAHFDILGNDINEEHPSNK